jgi:hypothetical protein
MINFLKKLSLFIIFFNSIFLLLVLNDLFLFDRVSNSYLNEVLNKKTTEDIIFIGSSRTKWSTIDSLLPKATYLAEGGQYAFGSLGVFSKLKRNDLLRDKIVFIDLVQSNEISNGNGSWWYFSEVFICESYAKVFEFPLKDWASVYCRISKDIFHFSPNDREDFKWKALDKVRGKHPFEPQELAVNELKRNFKECENEISLHYLNLLKRFAEEIVDIKQKFNCDVYIILPPYPELCLSEYQKIFGSDRIIDLSTTIDFKIEDFYDNTHLNYKGAFKFSNHLKGVIQNIQKTNESRK